MIRPVPLPDGGTISALLPALAALLAGPLAYDVLRRRPRALALLDGFVYVAVPTLVLLHVVPHALGARTVAPLAALAAGIAAPVLLEHTSPRLGHGTHVLALVLGLSGLLLHAALDGAALAPAPGADPAGAFVLAVVLHRLPVGLAVWWLVRPRWGPAGAAAVIGGLLAATVAGYAAATGLAELLHGGTVELYQAFVGGTLMHVIYHDHVGVVRRTGGEPSPAAEGLGALLALGLAGAMIGAGVGAGHEGGSAVHDPLTVTGSFLGLALTSAPALVVAYLVAAALGSSIRRIRPGTGLAPEAVLPTLPLLGAPLTLLRVAGTLAVGLLPVRVPGAGQDEDRGDGEPHGAGAPDGGDGAPDAQGPLGPAPSAEPFHERLRSAVDRTAPWIMAGLGLGAVAVPLATSVWPGETPGLLAVGLSALLGLPFWLCPAASTPLAAVALAGGLPPGATLAFLVAGPALSAGGPPPRPGRLAAHPGRTAVAAGTAWVAAAAVGGVVDGLVGAGVPAGWLVGPTMESLTTPRVDAVEVVSLALLAAAVADALLRGGVRRFVGGHGHGHDHGHDHGHPTHSHGP